jgi:hypothetical protein
MVRRLLLILLGPVLGAGLPLTAAETPCPSNDAVLFTSSDLRITCTADRLGRSALLLTNLDAAGERLSPAPSAPAVPQGEPAIHAVPYPAPLEPEPEVRRDDPVEVIVRAGGSGDAGEVEVRREAGAGSTIVINIDNRQASPPQPAPTLAYGWGPAYYVGLPGPYQFPEHFHFLGTSHDNSYPKWFGGLAFGTSRYADLYKPPAKDCSGSGCGSSR